MMPRLQRKGAVMSVKTEGTVRERTTTGEELTHAAEATTGL